MKRIWPPPLWLELVAAVSIALLITNAATGVFFRMAWQGSVEQRFRTEFAEWAAHAVAAVLAAESAESRERILKAMSGPGQRVSISAVPDVDLRERQDDQLIALLRQLEPSLKNQEVRVAAATRTSRPHWRVREGDARGMRAIAVMSMSVSARDGAWVNVDFDLPVPFDPTAPLLLSGGILVLMLLCVALWISRRIVQPLKMLETAASALGPGDAPALVPERGPRAVKAAIRSFNAMSQRLLAAMESQRVVTAAVAHDLRSPITSLKLRAEFVSDAETKERMLETLTEMETMTEAVIDLVRAGKSSEAARLLDLGALADSIVQDIADAGAPAVFDTSAEARVMIRRSEISRALRNLIENAVRYGGSAKVSMTAANGQAQIYIDDEGPGVPEDQLEVLFMPFARLETSRSRDTGGHGLGLTIARMIARGHGGDVTLENLSPKGLRATLRLPLAG